MIPQTQPHAAYSQPRSEESPAETHGEAWARTCRRLRAELGEAVYSSWLARLELVRIESGVAHLSVPTKFLKSWIQSHYTDRIRLILASEFGAVDRLNVEVRSSMKMRPTARDPGLERKLAGAGTPEHSQAAPQQAPPRQATKRAATMGQRMPTPTVWPARPSTNASRSRVFWSARRTNWRMPRRYARPAPNPATDPL